MLRFAAPSSLKLKMSPTPVFRHCFCSLKTGCKTYASVVIIFDIILIALGVLNLIGEGNYADAIKLFTYYLYEDDYTGSISRIFEKVFELVIISFLIHGVNQRKAGAVLPGIIYMSILSPHLVGRPRHLHAPFYVLIWLVILTSWQEIRREKMPGAAGGLVRFV